MLKAPIAVTTRLLAVGTLGTLTILLIATPAGSNAQQATPPPASPVPATSNPSSTTPPVATPAGSNPQQAAPSPASPAPPVPATSNPSSTIPIIVAPVTPAKPKYSAGSVITVYQLVDHGKGNYQPGNSIGNFVNYANPWTLGLHHQQADLKFFTGEPLGYMANGYFVAKEAGNYSFAVELDFPPTVLYRQPDRLKGKIAGNIACHYRFTIANQVVIETSANSRARTTRKDELACGLTTHGVGTIDLEPGFHPVQQWLACSGERKLKINDARQFIYPSICPESGKTFKVDSFPGDEVQVILRVRRPTNTTPTLVEADELVHK